MAIIQNSDQLRQHYRQPSERTANKVIYQLDKHSKQFIELANYLLISTNDRDGFADLSPRGGAPGFVKVLDDKTLLIPDAKGNNRLDTLSNVLHNPKVGLMFLVPGIDESLRLKGTASVHERHEFAAQLGEHRLLDAVLKIDIQSLFFHCGKAAMRADLWGGSHVDRSVFPSIGQIIKDQQQLEGEALTQEEMVGYYRETL